MTVNDVLNLVAALLLVVVLAGGVRLVYATPAQRRAVATSNKQVLAALARSGWTWFVNFLLLAWVLVSWRRVTRNLGLAYTDKHAVKRIRKTDKNGVLTETERPKVAYPYKLARPDRYGVVLTVWTRAGIGRAEFEKVTEHLANTWRCRRVLVEQRKPGRLTVRALRRDPLDARLSLAVSQMEGGVDDVRPIA